MSDISKDAEKSDEGKDQLHVYDFIENVYTYNSDEEKYARWFLFLHTLSASLQFDFSKWINQYKLFCKYKGETYRVTGASRLGDVWLAKNFDRDVGYDHRVNLKECSEWSPCPHGKFIEKIKESIKKWGEEPDGDEFDIYGWFICELLKEVDIDFINLEIHSVSNNEIIFIAGEDQLDPIYEFRVFLKDDKIVVEKIKKVDEWVNGMSSEEFLKAVGVL